MPRDYPEYEDESPEETYRDPLKPFLIALVVLLLLFAAIIVLLYMRLQTANTRAETLSQELTAVQVQLDDLRAQRPPRRRRPRRPKRPHPPRNRRRSPPPRRSRRRNRRPRLPRSCATRSPPRCSATSTVRRMSSGMTRQRPPPSSRTCLPFTTAPAWTGVRTWRSTWATRWRSSPSRTAGCSCALPTAATAGPPASCCAKRPTPPRRRQHPPCRSTPPIRPCRSLPRRRLRRLPRRRIIRGLQSRSQIRTYTKILSLRCAERGFSFMTGSAAKGGVAALILCCPAQPPVAK